MHSWQLVADELRRDHNPYESTQVLNWPPLWMVLVYLIDHVSRALDIPFVLTLQLLLIGVETLLVVVLYDLVRCFASAGETRRVVLVGIVLNPVAVLLVCQHGNFDVLVGFLVTLAVVALVFSTSEGGWLAAGLAIGVAGLTKTVPLVLAPLLAPRARAASRSARYLAPLLVVGPIVLGLMVIYVLAPDAVAHNVLRYRGYVGYFGLTGILGWLDMDGVSLAYARVTPALILIGLVVVARKAPTDARRVVLAAAVVMASIPVLGPAFAPQYAYWFLPLVAASYPLFDGRWRATVLVWYAVAVVTYLVDYALVPALGQFLEPGFPGVRSVGRWLARPAGETLLRLPLFVASIWLLASGYRRAFAAPRHP